MSVSNNIGICENILEKTSEEVESLTNYEGQHVIYGLQKNRNQ